jgi:hypothetical protein
MMTFLRAHGMDPGPLQRPVLAGAMTGFFAAAPGLLVFAVFRSLAVVADSIMQLTRPMTVGVLVAAFTFAGLLSGLTFQRAANDRRGGWLFGMVFGFVLWMAAPIVVLPMISGNVMAAGPAATGFLASFLVWGAVTGALFPHIHRPLQMYMARRGKTEHELGPGAAAVKPRILRRVPERRQP